MDGTIRYTIRPYDTIWMLAQIFNTTVDSIMELNPGIEPRNLFVGQVVTIRPGYQYYPLYPEIPGSNNTEDPDFQEDGLTDYDMDEGMSGDVMDLVDYFRLLWEQHVEWTRMTVMALVHQLPEADLITQRLLRNPRDFANAFALFYGEDAAQQLEELLTAHLTIAAELVQAAIAGNNNAVTDADRRWRDNADQIAAFLASVNPNWSEEDWSAMLQEHLDLLSENAAQMISGDYQESIDGYDEIELQALEMADMMAEGIAMQYPA